MRLPVAAGLIKRRHSSVLVFIHANCILQLFNKEPMLEMKVDQTVRTLFYAEVTTTHFVINLAFYFVQFCSPTAVGLCA